jgi:hypothetical protein
MVATCSVSGGEKRLIFAEFAIEKTPRDKNLMLFALSSSRMNRVERSKTQAIRFA